MTGQRMHPQLIRGYDYTYLRSQCRLKANSQKRQESSCASFVLISSGCAHCSVGGELDCWPSSKPTSAVPDVSNNCSPIVEELLLSTGVGMSSSGVESPIRYGACITGLMSNSKANGSKTLEAERRRHCTYEDEALRERSEMERRKGEDYVGLRRQLCGLGVKPKGA